LAPFFSILIPSYNRPKFITKCLDSILGNDFEDYEIIISDDNSPLASDIKKAVKSYIDKKKIHIYFQKHNLKEPGNKNFLVNKSIGKYNIILGDDDQLFPNTLKILKNYIEDNPTFDLFCFGYSIIDEDNEKYYTRKAPEELICNLNNKNLVKKLCEFDLFPFWLFHPSIFCCKNGVEKKIQYSLNAGIGEDFLFLIDFINDGRDLFIIPESLFMWRKIIRNHKNYQTNQSLGKLANVIARKSIYDHLLNRKDLNPVIHEFVRSLRYRKNFLYNAMISEKNILQKLDELKLPKKYNNEFRRLHYHSNYIFHFLKGRLKRCRDYIGLFGFKGLREICIVLAEKMLYKIRN
tara:strand:+ start:336 stop:1382 length:1047 start_codon:yes stop_codon:yes gene_type:complete